MGIAAVTGASGHLGGNLVRALLKEGKQVRVLVRNDRRAVEGLDVQIVEGDVLDRPRLAELIKGAETVFHLAAKISIAGENEDIVKGINIQGTANVVDTCLGCGVNRMVHVSSIQAFSTYPMDEAVSELRELISGDHQMIYDRTKAEGQRVVLRGVEKGLDAVIVNPSAIIGPNDFKISRLGEVLLDIYHGRLPLLIDGGFDWVDVRDAADGTLAAGKLGRRGESYILSGHWVHLKELAAMITEITGVKTPGGAIPLWMASVAAGFNLAAGKIIGKTPKFTPEAIKSIRTHRYISHQKATDELGYNPRPFKETIRDSFQWFREAGLLEQVLPNV